MAPAEQQPSSGPRKQQGEEEAPQESSIVKDRTVSVDTEELYPNRTESVASLFSDERALEQVAANVAENAIFGADKAGEEVLHTTADHVHDAGAGGARLAVNQLPGDHDHPREDVCSATTALPSDTATEAAPPATAQAAIQGFGFAAATEDEETTTAFPPVDGEPSRTTGADGGSSQLPKHSVAARRQDGAESYELEEVLMSTASEAEEVMLARVAAAVVHQVEEKVLGGTGKMVAAPGHEVDQDDGDARGAPVQPHQTTPPGDVDHGAPEVVAARSVIFEEQTAAREDTSRIKQEDAAPSAKGTSSVKTTRRVSFRDDEEEVLDLVQAPDLGVLGAQPPAENDVDKPRAEEEPGFSVTTESETKASSTAAAGQNTANYANADLEKSEPTELSLKITAQDQIATEEEETTHTQLKQQPEIKDELFFDDDSNKVEAVTAGFCPSSSSGYTTPRDVGTDTQSSGEETNKQNKLVAAEVVAASSDVATAALTDDRPLKISLEISRHEHGSRIVGEVSARELTDRDKRVLNEALKLTIDQWQSTSTGAAAALTRTGGSSTSSSTTGDGSSTKAPGTALGATTATTSTVVGPLVHDHEFSQPEFWTQKSLAYDSSEDPATSLTLTLNCESGELHGLKISARSQAEDMEKFVIERAATPPFVATCSAAAGVLGDEVQMKTKRLAQEELHKMIEEEERRNRAEMDRILHERAQQAIKIQAAARARRDRRRAQSLKMQKEEERLQEYERVAFAKRMERAATRIQSLHRGRRARSLTDEMREMRKNAASEAIQSRWRGAEARDLVKNLKEYKQNHDPRTIRTTMAKENQAHKIMSNSTRYHGHSSSQKRKAKKKLILLDLHHVHHHHHFHQVKAGTSNQSGAAVGGARTSDAAPRGREQQLDATLKEKHQAAVEHQATQLTTKTYVENRAESLYQGNYKKFMLDNPPFESAEEYYSYASKLPGDKRLDYLSPYQYTAKQRGNYYGAPAAAHHNVASTSSLNGGGHHAAGNAIGGPRPPVHSNPHSKSSTKERWFVDGKHNMTAPSSKSSMRSNNKTSSHLIRSVDGSSSGAAGGAAGGMSLSKSSFVICGGRVKRARHCGRESKTCGCVPIDACGKEVARRGVEPSGRTRRASKGAGSVATVLMLKTILVTHMLTVTLNTRRSFNNMLW
ncbi:unnamed protein product [Amoebophrya sp. A120]|nr:unnamed protein product [Amoebophrya sp. A120]|eukprot:GSA120T00020968001.1